MPLAIAGAIAIAIKGTDSPALAPSAQPSSCMLYVGGHDAMIWLTSGQGGADSVCTGLVSGFAKSGVVWQWQRALASIRPTGDGLICDVSRDGYRARVLDSGTAMYGSQACQILLASGWTEAAS